MGDQRRGEPVTIEGGRDECKLTDGGTQNGLWLKLHPEEGYRSRQKNTSWSDSEDRPLEQQLRAVFDHFELVIKAAVERREEEDRQAAERQRRWEAAMAKPGGL